MDYPSDDLSSSAIPLLTRLHKAPSVWYVRYCAFTYCFACFVFGLVANIIGPTALWLALRLHVAEDNLAPAIGASGLVFLLGGLPAGWLLDNLPGHWVHAASMIFQGGAVAVIPYCKTTTGLVIACCLIGFGYSLINTTLSVLPFWLSPTQGNRLLALCGAVYGVGLAAVPLLVNLTRDMFKSTTVAYHIVAVLAVSSAASTLLLPTPCKPPPALHDNRQVQKRIDWKLLLLVSGIIITNCSGQAIHVSWLPTYGEKYMHFNASTAQIFTSLFWVAFTSGRGLAVVLLSFLPPAHVLLCTVPCSLLGSLLALLPWNSAMQPWVYGFSVASIGFGFATGYANSVGIAASRMPCTGILAGYFGFLSGLGSVPLPVLVPILALRCSLGYQVLMWFSAILAVIQLALVIATVLYLQKDQGKEIHSVLTIDAVGSITSSCGGPLHEHGGNIYGNSSQFKMGDSVHTAGDKTPEGI